MRVQHSLKSDSQLDLSSEAMKNFTEGISRLSMSRKRMNTLLKTIIILEARKGRNMLAQDRRLCLQTLMLLADYGLSVGKELKEILGDAVKATYSGHMESIGTEELSYLSLCNTYVPDDISQLLVKTITDKFEQATQEQKERFVLAYPEHFSLDETQTSNALVEISENSNLIEIIQE